jgi:hypothetical protein
MDRASQTYDIINLAADFALESLAYDHTTPHARNQALDAVRDRFETLLREDGSWTEDDADLVQQATRIARFILHEAARGAMETRKEHPV